MQIQTATVIAKIAVCPRPTCGHKWTTRVDQPKACPKCKQYIDWG